MSRARPAAAMPLRTRRNAVANAATAVATTIATAASDLRRLHHRRHQVTSTTLAQLGLQDARFCTPPPRRFVVLLELVMESAFAVFPRRLSAGGDVALGSGVWSKPGARLRPYALKLPPPPKTGRELTSS